MKDLRLSSIFGFVACLLASAPLSAQSLILTTEENPPLNMTVDGKVGGLGTEVIAKVFEAAGVAYTVTVYPWARAYKMAQEDANTCVYLTTHTQERDPLFKWVGPLVSNNWVLFGRKDSPKIATLEDAKPYTIGGYVGDAKAGFLKANGFKVEEVANDRLNVTKLVAGRLDFWIQGERVGAYVAGLENANDVVPALSFREVVLDLACSKSVSDETIAKLNAAVKALTDDGTIATILKGGK